jgi:hypothetical protein
MKRFCRTELSRDQRIARGVLASVLLLGFLVLFLVPPDRLPLPRCVFHSVTGHSCLTCGMTRSLHAVSHGQWAESLRHHLFGPAVFAGMLLLLSVCAAEAIRGRKCPYPGGRKTGSRVVGACAVVWLLYWGFRLAAEFVA